VVGFCGTGIAVSREIPRNETKLGCNEYLCHGLRVIEPGNVVKAVRGEPTGTLVCAQEP
jgi:hypothetical protein